MLSSKCQPIIFWEYKSIHTARYKKLPFAIGMYVMSPAHTSFGCTGNALVNSRLGLIIYVCRLSVVLGTNLRG